MTASPAAERLAALLSEEQLAAIAEELEGALTRPDEVWVEPKIRCRGHRVRDVLLSKSMRVKSRLTRRGE